jgi:hypothetical protein
LNYYRGVFDGCISLTRVTIGTGLHHLDEFNVGAGAFYGCTSLTEINVAADNTHFYSIDGVLYWYSSTTFLVKYPARKTGNIFTIPDNVEVIGISAFSGNTSLTRVIIPDSVTSIHDWAFYGCTNLARVIFEGTSTYYIDETSFMGNLIDFATPPGNRISSGMYFTTAPVNENSIWKRWIIQGTYYYYFAGQKNGDYVTFSGTDSATYVYVAGQLSQTFYGTWTVSEDYNYILTTLNGGLTFSFIDENTIGNGGRWIKE